MYNKDPRGRSEDRSRSAKRPERPSTLPSNRNTPKIIKGSVGCIVVVIIVVALVIAGVIMFKVSDTKEQATMKNQERAERMREEHKQHMKEKAAAEVAPLAESKSSR